MTKNTEIIELEKLKDEMVHPIQSVFTESKRDKVSLLQCLELLMCILFMYRKYYGHGD